MNKILTFIINEDKQILLLHNNYEDLLHGGDIWYTVTGAVEDCDKDIVDTVKREVKEETNIDVKESIYQNVKLKYTNRNTDCIEYVYVSYIDNYDIKLNEEWIDYKWLNTHDFILSCHWYYDKEVLNNILSKALNKELYYKEELELL